MKSSSFLYALGIFGGAFASTNSTLDALVAESSANVLEILEERTASNSSAACNSETVVVRKEWAALSSTDKIEYIGAVKCLMTLPPITPLSVVPGVRSRFDDFGALHINLTQSIHWTVRFLTWHRYFLWSYEQALRNECGYTGSHPYWDWSSTDTVAAHPLFDGSETSISGNGEQTVHSSYVLIPNPVVVNRTMPSGTGGGCLTSGPFANNTINLGPFGAPVQDGFAYNPRCLTRDFRDSYLNANLHYDNVTAVMLVPDMDAYEARVEVGGGIHASGHTVTGGLQDDLWGSAQDPSFQFHHAQIDRIWATWQGLNQTVRTPQVAGTLTINNLPPSAPGTLDTIISLGYVAEEKPIRDLVSTIDGPFCYIYA